MARTTLSRLEMAVDILMLKKRNPEGNYPLPDLSRAGLPKSPQREKYLASLRGENHGKAAKFLAILDERGQINGPLRLEGWLKAPDR